MDTVVLVLRTLSRSVHTVYASSGPVPSLASDCRSATLLASRAWLASVSRAASAGAVPWTCAYTTISRTVSVARSSSFKPDRPGELVPFGNYGVMNGGACHGAPRSAARRRSPSLPTSSLRASYLKTVCDLDGAAIHRALPFIKLYLSLLPARGGSTRCACYGWLRAGGGARDAPSCTPPMARLLACTPQSFPQCLFVMRVSVSQHGMRGLCRCSLWLPLAGHRYSGLAFVVGCLFGFLPPFLF
jgi:hypothetical protein